MSLSNEAFEDIFINYYASLHGYAFSILKSELAAEEIVSDVFYRLWLKRETIKIDASLVGYLYKSVYHAGIDSIRHSKKKKAFMDDVLHHSTNQDLNEGAEIKISTKDFEKNLHGALLQLPEQCRTVFQLNRMEELSYKDIANHLGISLKTVEAHMGKALRRLRVSLAEFLTVIIILL